MNDRSLGALGAGVLLVTFAVASSPAGAQEMDIESFVRQTYIHGVPYDQARQYDAGQVPVLLEMLDNADEQTYWPNIVVTIGMIGDERAIQPLMEFFAAGRDTLSRSHYAAKSSVLFALGYLANTTESDVALDYLIDGVNPAAWERREIAWRAPYHRSPEDRNRQLSELSIIGLALSGRPEARDVLMSLKEPPSEEEAQDFRASVRDLVETALRDHGIIARDGLGVYYRRQRGPAPGGPDMITGGDEPPPILTGRREAPDVPAPAAEYAPRLPPTPALDEAPEIPEPAMPRPPQVQDDPSEPESEGKQE